MEGITVTPGGNTSHGQKPTYYNAIRNGRKVRVSAIDLSLNGDESTAQVEQKVKDYVGSAFGPLDAQIMFQKVN